MAESVNCLVFTSFLALSTELTTPYAMLMHRMKIFQELIWINRLKNRSRPTILQSDLDGNHPDEQVSKYQLLLHSEMLLMKMHAHIAGGSRFCLVKATILPPI